MKVSELSKEHEGRRFKVVNAKVGQAEEVGFVNDSERLNGQVGVITDVNKRGDDFVASGDTVLQAHVEWEDKTADGPGSLSLVPEDEIEFLNRPLTEAEVLNAQTLFRAARNEDLAVLRSTEVASGKEVALMCALTGQPGTAGVGVVPLAVLIDGNPYELYTQPDMESRPKVESPPGVVQR